MRTLRGYNRHALLSTGVSGNDALQLSVAVLPRAQDFDSLRYESAIGQANTGSFDTVRIADIPVQPEQPFLLRIDTDPVRYLRARVRNTPWHRNTPAFASEKTTLEIEELVEGRLIYPLDGELRDNNFRMTTNAATSATLDREQNEVLFTLRPQTDTDPGAAATPAWAKPACIVKRLI